MTFTDRLVEISNEDLLILRDLYLKDWPKHRIAYYTINHFALWLKSYPNIEDVLVWSLNGTWRDNGTVIIKNNRDIHFATLDPTQDTLVRALCLVEWSRGYLLCTFTHRMRPGVYKAIERAQIPVRIDNSYKLFVLPKEKARVFRAVDLDDDFYIRRLTVEEASTANAWWTYKDVGTDVLLEKMAKYNTCFGAYTNNKLVGWTFITSYGAIGVLHVLEEFRRRKIAQALVVKISQHIVKTLNLDPYTFIDATNSASISLFEKLGFQDQNEYSCWIHTNVKK